MDNLTDFEVLVLENYLSEKWKQKIDLVDVNTLSDSTLIVTFFTKRLGRFDNQTINEEILLKLKRKYKIKQLKWDQHQ